MANFQKGFTPSRSKTGYSSGKRRAIPIANAYGTSLGKGDPVKVSNGFLCKALNGVMIIGVFDGCKYVDPNVLQMREIDLWTAGTTMPSGALVDNQKYPLGFVVPADGNYFTIIADASVSAGQLGLTFPVSNGTPNAQYRRSTVVMNASVQVSADKNMVRVVSFPQRITTGPDQNPTLVEVEFVTTGYNS